MKNSDKSFLSRLDSVSPFTLLMVMVICMAAGIAVIPLLDVEPEPRPRQGKTITVSFNWNSASPKVIEQNVTSRIEGVVSAIKGVESISSVSNFGSGRVEIELKPQANVSATKFEIASAIKQIYKKFPEGVSYPSVTGGEIVNSSGKDEKEKLLLTYQLNAAMKDDQLKEYVGNQVTPALKAIEGVRRVDITGGRGKYVEISYDPMVLRMYGITVSDIEEALKGFMGRAEIIGELTTEDTDGKPQRKALYLSVDQFDKPIESMPIKNVGGSIIYMGDLATYEYKDRLPGSYYRLNGLSTIYLNIYVDSDAPIIRLSHKLRDKIDELQKNLKKGVYLTLTFNAADKQETELRTLVRRSLMSLLILLIFIFLIRRRWRYLFLVSVTLAANILIAVLIYWLADIRLHTFALAGITVSLGIIIDSSIVMVDHYLRHRDRNAFIAILAALLTTIGALVIIFFLPEQLQKDLYDFSWIIIINLGVSLIVALLFVPALIDKTRYEKKRKDHRHKEKPLADRLISYYGKYIRFTQKRKWIYIIILILLFGIPFHALPDKLGDEGNIYISQDERRELRWYEKAYNASLGSDFFVRKLKDPLSKYLGGTMRLFAEHITTSSDRRPEENEKRLNIRGKMPVGGSMHELNDKMLHIERFLSQFPEIEKFETNIGWWGGQIEVEFKEEARNTGFPYQLENKVIGQLISLGGADWSTYGVSERGFSNSLNLAYRSHRIEIAGYNYDRLYRFAEEMSIQLQQNPRVQDIIIETPGHENQEDELFMTYDKERIALDRFPIGAAHASLSELLAERELGRYRDKYIDSDIQLHSKRNDKFDLWQLENSYIDVNGSPTRLSNYMNISRRQAKNRIPRKNQEYVLRVAFNVLGSWNYSNKLIEKITDEFNSKFPVGFRCLNTTYGWNKDEGTQYWLLLLVVVIIYFMCAILFESLTQPLVIISLIPVSFIGTFLTFYFSGIPFGNGGFASMVLLAGIVVNAGIYQIYEYRGLLKKDCGEDKVHIYLKAFRNKVVPIFLTVLSTILGLVPFLFDRKDDGDFWFTFAVGSMGGLLFSILAYVFVMPIFLKLKNHCKFKQRLF
ncbi:MAG: efflux RND transporter permease subunit [Muribaculaceae bacterium]|nr:efflux RND transporter permease subunit [Muribaculaceae bacterium]